MYIYIYITAVYSVLLNNNLYLKSEFKNSMTMKMVS